MLPLAFVLPIAVWVDVFCLNNFASSCQLPADLPRLLISVASLLLTA